MPRFRNFVVNTSALKDGAVTTSKLANLAVTTPKIANAAITTAKIDDLAVTTAKIANLAVTNAKIASISADKITAGTITSQTITIGTGGQFVGADGWILDRRGFAIDRPAGSASLFLSPTAAGTNELGIAWKSAVGGGGSIRASIYTVGTGSALILEGGGGTVGMVLGPSTIQLRTDGLTERVLVTDSQTAIRNQAVLADGALGTPALRFQGANTGIWRETDAAFDGDGLGIRDANGRIATFTRVGNTSRLYWAESNDLLEYDSDNEQFRIVIQASNEFVLGTGGVLIPNVFSSTTASAANVNVAGDGTLARSTSSRRYKTAIRPWDRRASVLDLEPVLYRSRLELDDRRRVRLGLLAEDVAERFPLAAVLDAEGRPDAIDWNVITVGLLAAVRDLEGRVRQLEAAAV